MEVKSFLAACPKFLKVQWAKPCYEFSFRLQESFSVLSEHMNGKGKVLEASEELDKD